MALWTDDPQRYSSLGTFETKALDNTLADCIGMCVTSNIMSTETTPLTEYVVVRDGWKGCEYLRNRSGDDLITTGALSGAWRGNKMDAEMHAKALGKGWRVSRP